MRYLDWAFAMIAAKKDDDTVWTSQLLRFDTAFDELWYEMIWLKEDAEKAQKTITDRAEVQVQVAIEQIKADAEVEKERIKADAEVEKERIKASVQVAIADAEVEKERIKANAEVKIKADAEVEKERIKANAEVKIKADDAEVEKERIKANAEVKIKEATCSADVQKCSIKSEADVKINETVAQGIGDISKSTTDVGVKMFGIKSTSDILKSGAAVQGTGEIAAETEQAQMEPVPSELIHENVKEKKVEKAVVDVLDKFMGKLVAGAVGSVTIQVKVSESDKDRDDIEMLSIDVGGSVSRSAENKTLSKAKVANSEAFYTPSDWESGAGIADEAETDDDDDDKFATDNDGKRRRSDGHETPLRKKQKTMKDITPGGSLNDFIGIIKTPE